MECRDIKLLMDAYWDRHLPPEMAVQLEEHLGTCPGCRGEFSPVSRLLAEPEPVVVSSNLRDRILAAIGAAEIPVEPAPVVRSGYRWWMELVQAPWMGAVAACLVFAFMGLMSQHLGRPEPLSIPHATEAGPPNPLLLASWTQNLTLPGPLGPLPAVAQAVAMKQALHPRLPVLQVGNRVLEESIRPAGVAPAIPEIPVIVAGLSTLGA